MQTKKVSSGIYMYVHMCVMTINENRGHALEREQGGMYGRKQKGERMQLCYSLKKKEEVVLKRRDFNCAGGPGSLIPTLSKGQLHCLLLFLSAP